MAKKPRLYTSVDPELKAEAESKAEELKVSSSEFLKMCLRDGLGHFNLYQEREQLKTQLGEKADACPAAHTGAGQHAGRAGLCQRFTRQV